MVTVLQFVSNLTDRQAADAVRGRIDWKFCLGLELDDPGFDFSVLSEFRARLVEHGLEEVALDVLLARLGEVGLVKAGGKQRTDSTHVISAVRDLSRLELAGESVRACLETLAAVAPDWLTGVLDVTAWGRRYSARPGWQLPTSQAKRDALARAHGVDGFALLTAVYAPDAPAWLAELAAVDILRTVLVQNYTRHIDHNGREVVKWREASRDGLPPGRARLTSPYDCDARWSVKKNTFWNGYKVHLTETCDAPEDSHPGSAPGPELNVITNVATSTATTADQTMTVPIHQALKSRGLLPGEHYVDSGYSSAGLVTTSRHDFNVTLISPLLADTSAQARAATGYDRSHFTVDFDKAQVTCPNGQTSKWWSPTHIRGNDVINVKFTGAACGPCPARPQCSPAATTHGRYGRQLTILPREAHEAQTAARTEQAGKDWQVKYALRAGVEGTVHQAVAVTGTRHARYRGLTKTHLEHVYAATAINLIRLDAHWNGHPLDRARTSHLARLQYTLAT